jgi:DNA-binding MarR family transcriptional regulator
MTSRKKKSSRSSANWTPGAKAAATLEKARRDVQKRSLLGTLQNITGHLRIRFREGLRVRGHETEPAHFKVIVNLRTEGSRLTDLAARAGMTKQAMGKLVDELEELGYVHRIDDPADGRARLVCFSKLGFQLLRDSLSITEEIWREYEEILGASRLNKLRNTMEVMSSELDARRARESAIDTSKI